MKITESQLRRIIKEEISKALNENSEEYEYYEYYLEHPREGIYSDSEDSLEEAEKEAEYALNHFYKGASFVAIFGPQGNIVKLGDRYDEEEANEIKKQETL
jgi:hypothetical protein